MNKHHEMHEALKRRRGHAVDLTIHLGPAKEDGNVSDDDKELAPEVKDEANVDASHDPLDLGEGPESALGGEMHPLEKMLQGAMGESPLHSAAKAHHMVSRKMAQKEVKHLESKPEGGKSGY